MENTIGPPPVLGNTAGSAARPAPRIDQVFINARETNEYLKEIEQRLHSMIERLDGSRPTDVRNETAPDQPGALGALAGVQEETRDNLERIGRWLNELESLV